MMRRVCLNSKYLLYSFLYLSKRILIIQFRGDRQYTCTHSLFICCEVRLPVYPHTSWMALFSAQRSRSLSRPLPVPTASLPIPVSVPYLYLLTVAVPRTANSSSNRHLYLRNVALRTSCLSCRQRAS